MMDEDPVVTPTKYIVGRVAGGGSTSVLLEVVRAVG
jgi:hypothetical protein